MTNWIFNVGHNSGSYTSDISIPVGSGLDPELSSKYHNMSADLAYQLSKKGGSEEAWGCWAGKGTSCPRVGRRGAGTGAPGMATRRGGTRGTGTTGRGVGAERGRLTGRPSSRGWKGMTRWCHTLPGSVEGFISNRYALCPVIPCHIFPLCLGNRVMLMMRGLLSSRYSQLKYQVRGCQHFRHLAPLSPGRDSVARYG